MPNKRQKSAVLNQTVFPHELNNGVTVRTTEFAVVNKDYNFIHKDTIKKYAVTYLTKYGIPKENATRAFETGEVISATWRNLNMLVRIVNDGDTTNSIVKIYVQFYTKGYLMNGYEDEKQVYELSVSRIPTSILAANIGGNHTIVYTNYVDELNARIDAGLNKRID